MRRLFSDYSQVNAIAAVATASLIAWFFERPKYYYFILHGVLLALAFAIAILFWKEELID